MGNRNETTIKKKQLADLRSVGNAGAPAGELSGGVQGGAGQQAALLDLLYALHQPRAQLRPLACACIFYLGLRLGSRCF